MAPLSSPGSSQELTKALRSLESTIEHLPTNHAFVFHPAKSLWLTYCKGIVYGLGILTAFAIIVPLIVAILRHVQWVPLVGNFVEKVATQVEESNRR